MHVYILNCQLSDVIVVSSFILMKNGFLLQSVPCVCKVNLHYLNSRDSCSFKIVQINLRDWF